MIVTCPREKPCRTIDNRLRISSFSFVRVDGERELGFHDPGQATWDVEDPLINTVRMGGATERYFEPR